MFAPLDLGVPPRNPLTVVLLVQGEVRAAVSDWLGRFKGHQLHVIAETAMPEWGLAANGSEFHKADSLEQYHQALKPIGPVDAVVNLLPLADEEHISTWQRLFLHLREGGIWIIDRRSRDETAFTSRFGQWVESIISSSEADEVINSRDRALTDATAGVRVFRDLVIITKRFTHLLKLRDAETNRILEQRDQELSLNELSSLPGGSFIARSEVVSHASTTDPPYLETKFDFPELHLRHYTGPIAFVSNGLVHSKNTVLPDSFRHHLESNPRNVRLKSVSAAWGTPYEELRPRKFTDGSFYHLDSENPGHFGHLMTEVVSRLWGWEIAKKEIPDLKAAFRIRYPGERIPTLERQLFSAYGISQDDIVHFAEPMHVRSLVAATPQFHNQVPHYVHPGLMATWDRIREGMIHPDADGPDRIFVSRRQTQSNRSCRNTQDVEKWFAARRFSIVYPEDLSLSEQATIFAGARVIAGFGGSALFNTIYAENLETLIVLNHESYTARNEHLIAALIGCSVHYFWSEADVAQPKRGWSAEAYYSSWEFDFARNGHELNQVVQSA